MNNDIVADEEELYRSASIARGDTFKLPDNTYKVSSQCFRDRTLKISVNRARYHNNDPLLSKVSPSDGVLVLQALRVREIKITHDEQTFSVEVVYAPVLEPLEKKNLAHAEICTEPDCTKRAFEKLKASLAMQARWVIEPNDSLP